MVRAGGADLAASAGGEAAVRAASGSATACGRQRSGEWLEVLDSCGNPAWVQAAEVELSPQAAGGGTPGPGFELSEAVVVVDAGHGDRDWGAIGPEGLSEKVLNLDIATRVRELMLRSNSVDWTTGTVTEGGDVPAFGTVWLTRPPEGPMGGQYEAGLAFRAELANSAGADVLVSVAQQHRPQGGQRRSRHPGALLGGQRGLGHGSGRCSTRRCCAACRRSRPTGPPATWWAPSPGTIPTPARTTTGCSVEPRCRPPSSRGCICPSPRRRRCWPPRRYKQAYAEGVYRGVVRFLTTDDAGTGLRPPDPYPEERTPTGTSACVVPAQP